VNESSTPGTARAGTARAGSAGSGSAVVAPTPLPSTGTATPACAGDPPATLPSAANLPHTSNHQDLVDLDQVLPPELIEELMPLFISTTASSLGEIRKAMKNRALSNVVAKAHEIKGAAAGVGAAKVSACSKDLEMAAKQEDWQLIEQSVADLELAFERLTAIVNQSLPMVVSE
jgi:HPt (histidine-containing phosphotransfer) domain-containing protein